MPEQRWGEIREAFDELVALDAPEQSKRLKEWSEDHEARDILKGLLEAHASSDQDLLGTLDSDLRCLFQDVPGLRPQQVVAGRYQIVGPIGAGGMGDVYQAQDLELHVTVALKVLRPLFLSKGWLKRFRQEVVLARQVAHPNICRVFDIGSATVEGVSICFLTMEFIDGQTLRQRLESGRLGPQEKARVRSQLVAGVAALHASGIVHRDLKPGNVLLEHGTGRVVVTDFGLARPIPSNASALDEPSTSRFLGTPEYMAPECLRGEEATQASDVFSLALILSQLEDRSKESAGNPEFEKDDPWSATLGRALNPDPARRWASAGELQQELRSLQDLSGPAYRPFNRRFWMVLAVTAASIVALIALLLRYQGQSGDARRSILFLPPRVLLDERHRPVAEGIVEAISASLSSYPEFSVVPFEPVLPDSESDPVQVARSWNADAVVEMIYQMQRETLRVQLTVSDLSDLRFPSGQWVDSRVVEGTTSNLFRLQEEATIRLAEMLGVPTRPFWLEKSIVGSVEPRAYEYFLSARGYLTRDDKDQNIEIARGLLSTSLEINPGFSLALVLLCDIEVRILKGSPTAEARQRADRSCAKVRDLQLAPAHTAYGHYLRLVDSVQAAEPYFQKALAIEPFDLEAADGLARVYEATGRAQDAERIYLNLVAASPGNWAMHRGLGLHYYRQGDLQGAIEQYLAITRLTPDNAHGFFNLGGFLMEVGNDEEALRAFQEVLRIDPQRPGLEGNLATLYLRQGSPEEALDWLRPVLQRGTDNWNTHFTAGSTLSRLGQPEKASLHFREAVRLAEEALKVTPGSADAMVTAGYGLARLGEDQEKVLDYLQRAVRLAPNEVEVLITAAEAFSFLGLDALALAAFEAAVANGYDPSLAGASPLLSRISKSAQ